MDENEDLMIPQEFDSNLQIPYTLERQVGMSESVERKALFSAIVIFIGVFLDILILTRGSWGIGNRILKFVMVTALAVVVVRKFIINEKQYRNSIEVLEENDYAFSSKNYWNIIKISDTYPYVHTFKDGRIGMFIRMERGVDVGDSITNEFKHHEAISDMLNELSRTKLKMIHIDIMSDLGDDPRIEKLQDNLLKCDLTGVKEYMVLYMII